MTELIGNIPIFKLGDKVKVSNKSLFSINRRFVGEIIKVTKEPHIYVVHWHIKETLFNYVHEESKAIYMHGLELEKVK